MIDIKQPSTKPYEAHCKIDEDMNNKILILERKHKVNRSAVIRSLLEHALKEIK